MAGVCEGRVAIVTGAGRGIGRAHALELAAQGASVVVNDVDGDEAASVVAEIESAGGAAVANTSSVATWAGGEAMVAQAIEVFGGLDAVVNNAGFVRDRMFVSCSEEEWDAVVDVHLKGHFCVSRHAAAWWRDRVKAGHAVDARIVNTSSGAGILGSVGQSAYSAAKAAIATLTLVQAAELARYGVTANALAPAARTRMTEAVFAEMMAPVGEGEFDAMDPSNIAPIVAWLASAGSAGVTGRLFEVEGGKVSIAEGWHHGPALDIGRRWAPADLGPAVEDLLATSRPPDPVYGT
jgi:NAD(P)-dependent dehydrogenase (short-subunit alcohol dehydrogenase family)